jgi:ribosome-associated toxin RatA of RatAB toxin-antitoxin module
MAIVLVLAPAAIVGAAEWSIVHQAADLTIEARAHPDSPVKELRAEGRIEAPPGTVWAVIADLERYPEFMPYVKASRVLAREPGGVTIAYQQLSFGGLRLLGVSDRDYVIRIVDDVATTSDGRPLLRRVWTITDVAVPSSDPSVIRLTINRGAWLLTPAADGATLAVYCLFTDPGGSLPAWVVNRANQSGIPDVFKAVREAAKEARYAGRPMPSPAPGAASTPERAAGCTRP